MARHFHEEVRELKEEVLKMGGLVEQSVQRSIKALFKRDTALAQRVMDDEKSINDFEIKIDEKGHNLFALDQPMAVDMRVITAILKVNTDLERMGDHAYNIAERVVLLTGEPSLERQVRLTEMALAVQNMLNDAMRAFASDDAILAAEVLIRDDEIDAYNDSLYLEIQGLMEKNPAVIKTGMLLARVGHDLERIADLSNNIVEDVIYLKKGKEVRHHVAD